MKLKIDANSRIPKYRQIVDSVIQDILRENLKIGQKIPSINEISEDHYLSRDTVEKAYNVLKEKKIITSTKGKGYYIAKTDLIFKVKILFLLNKLSSYKMRIYNSFVNSMGTSADIDLEIYHCEECVFLHIIEKYRDEYDFFVIMPHFKDEFHQHVDYTPAVLDCLSSIPTEKLILVDNIVEPIKGNFAAVYQDFKNDIYTSLEEAEEKLRKYNKLVLVYPKQLIWPYPKEILLGFRKFCVEKSFEFEVIDEIYNDMELHTLDAYITIEEMDLVNLVKQAREQGYVLGEDIGIISYNDTPLKELLGITVVTTDFKVMGETAAYMILKNKKEKVKNAFKLIMRTSI